MRGRSVAQSSPRTTGLFALAAGLGERALLLLSAVSIHSSPPAACLSSVTSLLFCRDGLLSATVVCRHGLPGSCGSYPSGLYTA